MISARQHIENLIAGGKMEEAIRLFLQVTDTPDYAELRKDVIQLSARFQNLKAQKHKKLISHEQYDISYAQISHALTDDVARLPNDLWLTEQPQKPVPRPEGIHWQRWIAILGIVSSIMGIIGVSLKDVLFPEPQPAINPSPTPSAGSLEGGVKPKINEPEHMPGQADTHHEPENTSQTEKKFEKTPPKPVEKKQNTPTNSLPAGYTRSANPKVSDGMELVFKTDDPTQMAFFNISANKVICCYDDAQKFINGKARVKQNGRYFFIDKKGNEVKED